MKKIRCPKCSVINLEGFVTYPNCAGCGAPLPNAEAEGASVYRRQVGPVVWATVLGGAVLGLVFVAAKAFEKPVKMPPRIVLMGSVPHDVRTGDVFTVTLHIDAMDTEVPVDTEPLHDVRLRIPSELLKRFAFLSLAPAPDSTANLGNGRYFVYNVMNRGSQLQVKMRALRVGPQPFLMSVRELNQTSATYKTQIDVAPALVD